jgi:hypothetical protein
MHFINLLAYKYNVVFESVPWRSLSLVLRKGMILSLGLDTKSIIEHRKMSVIRKLLKVTLIC